LQLLRSATEVFTRLRHIYLEHPEYFEQIETHTQGGIVMNELCGFAKCQTTSENFGNLAADPAYKTVQLASILTHPCQLCAEDTGAWHTRYAFCKHEKS